MYACPLHTVRHYFQLNLEVVLEDKLSIVVMEIFEVSLEDKLSKVLAVTRFFWVNLEKFSLCIPG